MGRVVKELGVPAGIIGKMVVTPPDEMVWLSPNDLRSMGVTMTGKPAQIPPEQDARSQVPLSLEPTVQPKKESSWDDLVGNAVATSSRQNNGKPLFHRVCQPELKICVSGVYVKGDGGKDLLIKKTEDMAGNTVSRELCEFNVHGDIRVCVDWDTGRKHRDMQDHRGNWSKIADE
jgi:hypothetical protein